MIAGYVNVPVYKAFHQWLGREEQLARHWELWAAGDRAGAVEAIPDEVVDELIALEDAGRLSIEFDTVEHQIICRLSWLS